MTLPATVNMLSIVAIIANITVCGMEYRRPGGSNSIGVVIFFNCISVAVVDVAAAAAAAAAAIIDDVTYVEPNSVIGVADVVADGPGHSLAIDLVVVIAVVVKNVVAASIVVGSDD